MCVRDYNNVGLGGGDNRGSICITRVHVWFKVGEGTSATRHELDLFGLIRGYLDIVQY